jgi:hypothetical protein
VSHADTTHVRHLAFVFTSLFTFVIWSRCRRWKCPFFVRLTTRQRNWLLPFHLAQCPRNALFQQPNLIGFCTVSSGAPDVVFRPARKMEQVDILCATHVTAWPWTARLQRKKEACPSPRLVHSTASHFT